jgi:hypothetical protein
MLFDDDFLRQQEEILRRISQGHDRPAMSGGQGRSRATTAGQEARTPAYRPSSEEDEADESDEDFCKFLEDEHMIQEQRRILEQFGREQSQKTTERPSSVDALTSRLCDAAMLRHATLASYREDLVQSSSASRQNPYFSSQQEERISNVNTKTRTSCPDHVVKVGSKSLRVQGTAHTYKSIAHGKATIVQCSSCQAILQVGISAKLVYCTNCKHVTPIQMAKEIATSSLRNNNDSLIARSVQQQEMDVACARKLARLSRQGRQHPT